jgi:hypothetical protein
MKRYSRGGCNQAQIFSVVFRFSERISDGNRTSAYPVSVATEQGFAASSPYPKTCGGREYHVEIDSRLKNMPHRETEPGIIPLRLPEAARRAPQRDRGHLHRHGDYGGDWIKPVIPLFGTRVLRVVKARAS